MASYVNDLKRMSEIAKECTGKKVFFPYQTMAQVIENPANNISMVRNGNDEIMMFVTSYQSKRQASDYETSVGSYDSCLVVVNFDEDKTGTTMTCVGVLTGLNYSDMIQMIMNLTGLKQTGVPSDPEPETVSAISPLSAIVPLAFTNEDTIIDDDKIIYRKSSAANFFYERYVETDEYKEYYNNNGFWGIFGHEHYIEYKTPAVVAPDNEGNTKFFAMVNFANSIIKFLRNYGVWKAGLIEASRYETHSDFRIYNSALWILEKQVKTGAAFNDFIVTLTPDESYMAGICYDLLSHRYMLYEAGDGLEANFWQGFRTLVFTSNNLSCTVTLTLYCYNLNAQGKLFTCTVESNGRILLRPPNYPMYYNAYKGTFYFYRNSVDEQWQYDPNHGTYTDTRNQKTSAPITIFSPPNTGHVNGIGLSSINVTWVQQDPNVKAPENDGDTIQNTYNNYYDNSTKIGVQNNYYGDVITKNEYIEIHPSVPTPTPEKQPSSEQTQDGTIVDKKGDIIINVDITINQNVQNNIVDNQPESNPNSGVDMEPPPSRNPWQGGGSTGGGAQDPKPGEGTVQPDQGEIDPPVPPQVLDVFAGNFFNIYQLAPDLSSPTMDYTLINEFNKFLWSSDTWDTLIKYFSNPMDAVLSFGLTFVDPSAVDIESASGMNVGVLTWGKNVGDQLYRIKTQYVKMSCGEIKVNNFYSNAMDYEPFTSVSIYLPFIGVTELSASDVMGKWLEVTYSQDLVSGTGLCVIMAKVKDSSGNVETQYPVGTYDCNLLCNIPLSSADFSRIYSAAIGAGVGASLGVAGAVVSNPIGGELATLSHQKAALGAASSVIGGVNSLASNMTIPITQSGHMNSMSGAMGEKRPYIIIRRRNPYMPSGYSAFQGYPANEKATLANLHGFTKIAYVHVSGIPATDDELDMIESLLKEGVIL